MNERTQQLYKALNERLGLIGLEFITQTPDGCKAVWKNGELTDAIIERDTQTHEILSISFALPKRKHGVYKVDYRFLVERVFHKKYLFPATMWENVTFNFRHGVEEKDTSPAEHVAQAWEAVFQRVSRYFKWDVIHEILEYAKKLEKPFDKIKFFTARFAELLPHTQKLEYCGDFIWKVKEN